jgi:uncharacterized protein GlcG (DUF336 family)
VSAQCTRAAVAGVALLVLGVAAQAAAPAVVTLRTLSFDAASTVALAALQECRQRGHHVSVTVLDAAGTPLVVLHDDGAPPHTTENSDRKAYTALTMRGPSADFGKRVASNPGSAGALSLARITTLEGGLPVRAGNDVIGAVGISGAPTGADDVACVNAGLAKVAANLADR